MKAAVVRKPHEVGIEEVDLAPPGPGELCVRIAASGVCHTDLSVFDGSFPIPLPAVPGHEGAGVVESVGPGIADVNPGDHVVLVSVTACGHCFQCNIGAYSQCEVMRPRLYTGKLFDDSTRMSIGGEAVHHFLCQSSFAEHAVVPRATAVKIRPDAPLETICVLGCGAMTGIGAVLNRARVRPGESVMILGVGGVGLSALLGARVAGAYPIIAVDRAAHALDAASDLGATHVIDAKTEDVVSKVLGITTRGVDHAIDVVGAEGTVETCLQAVRAGGQVVVVGATNAMATAAVDILTLLSEKRLTGSAGGSSNPNVDIPRYVDLFMDGRLPIDRLVTGTYRLDQVAEAVADLEAGRPGRGVLVME